MSVNKLYAWGSTASVILAVVTGLMLSGTPKNQRKVSFDIERVNDMRGLTYHIENFRNDHARLPLSLEQMVDGSALEALPRDPESNMNYMYIVVSQNTYRLCGDFNLASQVNDQATFWDHEAGYHCYEVILPEAPLQDANVTPAQALSS